MSIQFIGEVTAEQLTLGLEFVEDCTKRVMRAVHKAFRPYHPDNQMVTLQIPKSILPADHLAWFVLEVSSKLDLSEILSCYKGGDGRGQPPYDPLMMVRLLIYCNLKGIQSTRGIEETTYDDIGCRMITCDQHPDHTKISNFRKQHLAALAKLFEQSVQMCDKAGLVDLKNVATDGTKLQANASLHHAMSYDHMCEKAAKYEEEIPEIQEKIKAAMKDVAAPARNSKLAELQKDLQIREKRLPVIQASKAALEEEHAEQLKQSAADNVGKSGGRGKKKQADKPADKKQRNFTDSDSRVQPTSKKGWLQGYNAQAAVCGKTQIIVGQYVVQTTNDRKELLPMAKQIHERFERLPDNFTADNGYFSEAAVSSPEWEKLGPTNLLIAPGKEAKGKKQSAPVGRIASDISIVDRMRRKLRTKAGHAAYSLRKCIVEPVFGQIKDSVLGFDQFHLRGLQQVNHEFSFVCAIHNLMKLYRHGWNPAPATS